jgi:hypothetical protein
MFMRNALLGTILPVMFVAAPVVSGTVPNIGVVISDGSFQMNNAQSTGSATVTDGSSVLTNGTGASIRLTGGGRVMFGADSRGTVYSDRLVLERGSALIAGYSAKANSLRISADGDASATVSLKGKVVQVAALTGSVHVFSAAGLNVANLVAGEALDLQAPKPGLEVASSLTGCVSRTGDTYLVTDEISRVTAELRGGTLKAGEKIRVTGRSSLQEQAGGGSSQVLRISKVTRLSGGCKVAMAAAGAAGVGVVAGTSGAVTGAAATGARVTTATTGAAVTGVAATGVAAVGAETAAAVTGAMAGTAAAAGISTTVAVVAGVSVAAAVGTAVGVVTTNSSTATPATLSHQ